MTGIQESVTHMGATERKGGHTMKKENTTKTENEITTKKIKTVIDLLQDDCIKLNIHDSETYNNAMKDSNFISDLISVGKLLTFGFLKLKRVSDSAYNPIAFELTRGVMSTFGVQIRQNELIKKISREPIIDSLGDTIGYRYVNENESDIVSVLNETFSDGYDIYQDSIVALLSEIKRACDNNQIINFNETYEIVERDRRARYHDETTELKTRKRETTAINNARLYLNRHFKGSAPLHANTKHKTLYVEFNCNNSDNMTDNYNSDNSTEYYVQRKLYNDSVLNYENETEYLVSDDSDTFEKMEEIIKSLNLTVKQEKYLKYRLQGKGYRWIAQKCNVNPKAIYKSMDCIKKKVKNCEYFKNYMDTIKTDK